MTQDALSLLGGFFSIIWEFFRNFIIPGTNVSIAQLFFFVLFVFLISKYVKKILSDSSGGNVGKGGGDDA